VIESSSLLAFLAFTFVLVITPGASTAVVVRQTLLGGRAAGCAAASGAAVGNISHGFAAGLGLGLLVARWPAGIVLLRVGGAAYLAWLGLRSGYRAVRYTDGGLRIATDAGGDVAGDPSTGGFRQGLTVALLNPATMTFYLVVVPSFLPVSSRTAAFAVLAAVHVAMAFACHLLWVVAMETLRRVFRAPLARRLFEGAVAIALFALAARIVLSR
jgi:threonine/homoserine/homoserine lactone efflux protein